MIEGSYSVQKLVSCFFVGATSTMCSQKFFWNGVDTAPQIILIQDVQRTAVDRVGNVSQIMPFSASKLCL